MDYKIAPKKAASPAYNKKIEDKIKTKSKQEIRQEKIYELLTISENMNNKLRELATAINTCSMPSVAIKVLKHEYAKSNVKYKDLVKEHDFLLSEKQLIDKLHDVLWTSFMENKSKIKGCPEIIMSRVIEEAKDMCKQKFKESGFIPEEDNEDEDEDEEDDDEEDNDEEDNDNEDEEDDIFIKY